VPLGIGNLGSDGVLLIYHIILSCQALSHLNIFITGITFAMFVVAWSAVAASNPRLKWYEKLALCVWFVICESALVVCWIVALNDIFGGA
jgi:hypothetical protein